MLHVNVTGYYTHTKQLTVLMKKFYFYFIFVLQGIQGGFGDIGPIGEMVSKDHIHTLCGLLKIVKKIKLLEINICNVLCYLKYVIEILLFMKKEKKRYLIDIQGVCKKPVPVYSLFSRKIMHCTIILL